MIRTRTDLMRPLPQILVVSRNYPQREMLHRWLVAAGYDVDVAEDFDGARSRLEAASPDVLVSDIKLDAYNGLHLAIWSRGRSLTTKTLLIGDPDRVLEKEAERERALYVSPPLTEKAFVAAVGSLLGLYSPARRSPRKRVLLDGVVDGLAVSILDVSNEGLKIELANADALALPPFFTVLIPQHELVCRFKRVWTARPRAADGLLWCGAALPTSSDSYSPAWRHLVELVPGMVSHFA